MIAGSLFCINVLLNPYARNVTPAKTVSAGLAADALLPASSMKNISVPNFQDHLMSAMAVLTVTDVLWKNTFTMLLMLKKSMNWSEANPAPALLFLKVNSDRSMTLFLLF